MFGFLVIVPVFKALVSEIKYLILVFEEFRFSEGQTILVFLFDLYFTMNFRMINKAQWTSWGVILVFIFADVLRPWV